MSLLTNSGRSAIAASIKEQPIHLAWGTGDSNWNNSPPTEDIKATGLINEIGRRVINSVSFCIPDAKGDIVTPDGRFKSSDISSSYLHFSFIFDFEDSPNAIIRELGVMIGTKVIDGLPEGQRYFLPHEIKDKGILLLLEHTAPLIRTIATRDSFSFVISF